MKLKEISEDYRTAAELIHSRIKELAVREKAGNLPKTQLFALRSRISKLYAIRREMLELAALTAHYYDRGYRADEKYSI